MRVPGHRHRIHLRMQGLPNSWQPCQAAPVVGDQDRARRRDRAYGSERQASVARASGTGVHPQHGHLACRDPNLAGGLPLQRHGTYLNMINEQIHQRVAEIIGAQRGDQDDLLT